MIDNNSADDVIKLAGVLVRCLPEQRQPVIAAIEAEPGATVEPESTADALIVIIQETSQTIFLTEQITRIQNIPSVISASLIYHHNDTAASGNKEMAS